MEIDILNKMLDIKGLTARPPLCNPHFKLADIYKIFGPHMSSDQYEEYITKYESMIPDIGEKNVGLVSWGFLYEILIAIKDYDTARWMSNCIELSIQFCSMGNTIENLKVENIKQRSGIDLQKNTPEVTETDTPQK